MNGEIQSEQSPAEELNEALSRGYGPRIARFALAVLGGAIPLGGGVFSGSASAWSEAEQEHFNKVFKSWLQLQQDELKEIGITIAEILTRLDLNDDKIVERIENPAYLSLIKKAFRDWSAAESEEKRVMVRNLLTNAAVHKICTDAVVRMFIQWIDLYSENHFAVLKFIYKNIGCTRWEIWLGVHGEKVREDSAEADLFKLIILEFTTGYVIRQHREKDGQGNYFKTPSRKRRSIPSHLMKSAFDDDKEYELTELGKQFVRYTMENVMPRIGASANTDNS